MLSLFYHIVRCLRTLYIVWSLVRRRITQRLTMLQTMCNVLKYRKILLNVALGLRCVCVDFFNLLKTSTVSLKMINTPTCQPFHRARSLSIAQDFYSLIRNNNCIIIWKLNFKCMYKVNYFRLKR